MDDIAIEQNGHAEEIERPGRVACCESLEREGHRVEQGGRQGHHEEQEEHWEGHDAEDSPPEMEENQTRQDHDKRASHKEILGADVAQEESPDSKDEHGQADPAAFSGQL